MTSIPAFFEYERGQTANFDLICFLCQQGTEKLVKGALISRSVAFPKIHDLVQLHRSLATAEPVWAWDESELQWLSFSAVNYRYPGEDADQPTAKRACDIARKLQASLTPLLD